ncbi:MAG: FAD-dependent thymidylate synthase [Tumebacillaceae bacterium]
MAVKLEYKGKTYKNVVEMGQDMPLLSSVMIGWYDGGELLCANAGANCYDTNINTKIVVDKDKIREMLEKDDFSDIYEAIRYEVGKVGTRIITHCRDSHHNTVIEHGAATFFKKVPIFVARQDLRARIASFDERSLRYCRATDGSLTYYITDYLDEKKIEQQRAAGDMDNFEFLKRMREDWVEQHERTIQFYSKYTDEELNERFQALELDGERVRETVRAALPLGINTMYVDTRNLWSWYHHSAKRLCLRAQKEIRLVRRQEVNQLRKVFPTVFGDVHMPCYMAGGCPEQKTCGVIDLHPQTRLAIPHHKKVHGSI